MKSWAGVTVAGDQVTRLNLPGRGLSGTIPDLSKLASLTRLDLRGNTLSGSLSASNLPADIAQIYLNNNALSGAIPDLSGLAALTTLGLAYNDLSGTLAVGNFPASITNLYLNNNGLSGAIPDLSALTALQILNLGDNGLSGSLDASHFPTGITQLLLEGNQLSGAIPDLSALTALQILDLGDNGLSGSLDASHFPTSITELYLNGNALSGAIPDLSGTSLNTIWLNQNQLSGPVSAGHFPASITNLFLNNNELTGPIPDLSALTALQILDLGDNGLSGSLDASHFPTGITRLQLNGNQLTGPIPDLGGTSLDAIWLHQNQLSGTISASHFPTGIVSLQLAGNPLTGGIPSALGNLSALEILSLCSTDLDASAILPSGLAARLADGTLTLFSCLRIEDAQAAEGRPLSFSVVHDAYPVRGSSDAAGLALRYETAADTATQGADYTGASMGSVIIPANTDRNATSSSTSISVATTADSVDEPPETLTMTLSPTNDEGQWGTVLPLKTTATGTIADEPIVSVRPADEAVVTEGEYVLFTLTASPAPAAAIQVLVNVAQDGSFAESNDLGDRGVSIGAGREAATLRVITDDDSTSEPSGAISVTVLDGTGYSPATGSGATASRAIRDNDGGSPPQTPVNPPPSGGGTGGGGGGSVGGGGGGGGGGSGGQRPEVSVALEARGLPSGGALSVDLSEAFRSPGGSRLAFTATSSDPTVASVSVEDGTLAVRGLLPGEAEITVTAMDGTGRSISQRFAVTVGAPEAAWLMPPASDP
ncbi:MAG: Ig-like domain-containing protein, partial [Gammaproteobacteria bacterium]|nr:Ig-like domain-containing protein [Gammaproteobacteria bacterium]